MANILVAMNEKSFMERTESGFKFNAHCGKHSTLAYILAEIELGNEVFLYDQSLHSLNNVLKTGTFPIVRLNKKNFGEVVSAYKTENKILKERAKLEILKQLSSQVGYKYDEDKTLTNYSPTRVSQYVIESSFHLEDVAFNQIEGLNARVDPMISSFCEEDKNIAINAKISAFKWSMDCYKKIFPQFVFNCPSDERIGDKISTRLVDEVLLKNGKPTISIPTAEFSIVNDVDNARFYFAIAQICSKRAEMFPNQSIKIVLKPRDSAQSYGVFGIEIVKEGEFGLNLEELKKVPMATLMMEDLQLLKVQPNLSNHEMKEIVNIMLYVQSMKISATKPKEISDILETELLDLAKELYDSEIQVQPFLDGIVNGDIRVNIIKDDNGNWIEVGHVFRAKILSKESVPHQIIGSQFTSCYTAGKATSSRVEFILSKSESQSLDENIELLLGVLNGDLKNLYQDCREIGVDLISVGNGKMMLGEINHTDPALAPISEMMYQTMVEVVEYLQNLNPNNLCEEEKKFIKNYHNIANKPPHPKFQYDGGLGSAKIYCEGQIIEQRNKN